jgi:hypothetical protein
MKKIACFDRLDSVSLLFSLILRLRRQRVVYRVLVSELQNPTMRTVLSALKISQVGYARRPGRLYTESLKLQLSAVRDVLEGKIKRNGFYESVVGNLNLDADSLPKLDAAFTSTPFSNFFDGGISSIPILNNVFPPNLFRVALYPSEINSYIVLRELKQANVEIKGSHAIGRQAILLFPKITRFCAASFFRLCSRMQVRAGVDSGFQETTEAGNASKYSSISAHALNAQFGFVPHRGLRYGNSFSKTYFFAPAASTNFFRERALVISFESELDRVSERYLRMKRIPYICRMGGASEGLMGWLDWLRTYGVSLNGLVDDPLIYLFLTVNFQKIRRWEKLLKGLPNLKAVYFHYDILAPSMFIFACHLRGIETISCQERPIQYTYFHNQCFDHYFISGEGFIPSLKAHGYRVGQYHSVGLPRSGLIRSMRHDEKRKLTPLREVRQGEKIIVCFGLIPLDADYSMIYGEDGCSPDSTLELISALVDLAATFSETRFVLKFKMTVCLKELVPASLFNVVMRSTNLVVCEDTREVNSYDLASAADLVIGKQTSIVEESFAAGKPIIVYDNEDYISGFNYILNEIGVVVKDREQLKARVREFSLGRYRGGQDLQSLREKYFLQTTGEDGYDDIRFRVRKILEGEQN